MTRVCYEKTTAVAAQKPCVKSKDRKNLMENTYMINHFPEYTVTHLQSSADIEFLCQTSKLDS